MEEELEATAAVANKAGKTNGQADLLNALKSQHKCKQQLAGGQAAPLMQSKWMCKLIIIRDGRS